MAYLGMGSRMWGLVELAGVEGGCSRLHHLGRGGASGVLLARVVLALQSQAS